MSVPLKQHHAKFKQSTYIVYKNELYYIISVATADGLYYLENCKTLKQEWIKADVVDSLEPKEVTMR